MEGDGPRGLGWRIGMRSLRSKLMALVALAVSIPALLTCLALGIQLNRQARSLFTQELAASLETFSLIIQDAESSLRDGLVRAAADNTLQITLDLGMRSQLAGYIDAQREVLQIAFLAAFDSREGLIANSLAPRSIAGPWRLGVRSQADSIGCVAERTSQVQLVDCDGTNYLVSVVPIVRTPRPNLGDAASRPPDAGELGYLMGGIALAAPRFIEALRNRKIEHPIIWVNGQLVYSGLSANPIVLPDRLDGSTLEYYAGDTAYLGTARETILGPSRLVYAVVTPLAPLRIALFTSVLVVAAIGMLSVAFALIAAGLLATRLLRPIGQLREGAARIGGGDLSQRISVSPGDELAALADQFNNMAERLQDSYTTLERKVEERTHQLALANRHKSRFIAAASHDLRQPLHALNLFVAQLRSEKSAAERKRLVGRIDAAVSAMNDLFNALLDMSKLDAEMLEPRPTKVAAGQLLRRMETTFADAAREKGLRLRVVSSGAWIESDPILLERIMLNLVSNAVRYTDKGGVVVGCRHHGALLHIEVWDSGIGIPEDQQRNVFGEFVQLARPGHERVGGLGLGLSIVERLCRLLGHRLTVASRPGRGSCFAIEVPLASAPAISDVARTPKVIDPIRGRLIVIIDDDQLVLDGMRGILSSWKCEVITADSIAVALAEVSRHRRRPDVIISDYQLASGQTGIEAIEALCDTAGTQIPAFLISGDTTPERLRQVSESGYHLLHKPVPPTILRSMLSQMLRGTHEGRAGSIAMTVSNAQEPLAASSRVPQPQ